MSEDVQRVEVITSVQRPPAVVSSVRLICSQVSARIALIVWCCRVAALVLLSVAGGRIGDLGPPHMRSIEPIGAAEVVHHLLWGAGVPAARTEDRVVLVAPLRGAKLRAHAFSVWQLSASRQKHYIVRPHVFALADPLQRRKANDFNARPSPPRPKCAHSPQAQVRRFQVPQVALESHMIGRQNTHRNRQRLPWEHAAVMSIGLSPEDDYEKSGERGTGDHRLVGKEARWTDLIRAMLQALDKRWLRRDHNAPMPRCARPVQERAS